MYVIESGLRYNLSQKYKHKMVKYKRGFKRYSY